MTWQWKYTATANSSINLFPTTGAWATYYLKETLKQAGWTVPASSDGTTYNAAGDQITTGASGANGMANASAWFRIQSPAGAGGREFTFQRTSNTSWRIKFSHSAGFTSAPTGGGATDLDTTPSATDEQILLGGGTDALPTFAGLYNADAGYKIHVGTDAASPYAFYMAILPNGGGQLNMFAHIPLEGYPAGDVAPYLITLRTANGMYGQYITDYTTGTALQYGLGRGYYQKGLGGEAWVIYPGMGLYANATLVPDANSGRYMAQSPYTGNSVMVPIPVGRRSGVATPGWKGWVPLTMMGWRLDGAREGRVMDFSGMRYAVFNDFYLRWPNDEIPVV